MEWFKMRNSTMLMRIATDDIVYIKADGNYSHLVLINGRSRKITTQLGTFEANLKLLQSADLFIRVGRSLIVNRKFVQLIDLTEQIIVFGGQHLIKVPTAEDLKPRVSVVRDPAEREIRDIYTVKAPREALKELKEILETSKN